MIDYLLEIIFKDIQMNRIGFIIKDLSSSGEKIASYNVTCNCPEFNWSDEKFIEELFSKNKNFGLFINLKELIRDGFCLPNCGIAIYKNEDTINLEINFQLSDLKDVAPKGLTKKLMGLAKSIAIQYQINDYFCGVEPSQEMEMRLFTNDQTGPFSIEN